MALGLRELVDAHAALGSAGQVLARRRTLYTAAVELAFGASTAHAATDRVVDNPAVRAHLGAVLGGTAIADPAVLQPLDVLVGAGGEVVVGPYPVRIASTAAAADTLAPALALVRSELRRHDRSAGAGNLLTGHDVAFAATALTVHRGVELALRAAPELVADLLPHVALLAVVEADDGGRLGSASVREYPGLVVIPRPGRAVEVAEAILHEGAHQKLFDLATTGPLLAPASSSAPALRPSWTAASAPRWPFEQCVAAFHAYCALAAAAPGFASNGVGLPEHSLLPVASARAEQLGCWLDGHRGDLGRDGRELLDRLTGRACPPLGPGDPGLDEPTVAEACDAVVRRCGEWDLVLSRRVPTDIWWVPRPRAGRAR